ncbi:MAG: ATP-binding protein [Candidatus Thiodiazotropha sp.]
MIQLKQSDNSQLCDLIIGSDDFLLDMAVEFAKEQGYLKYTATSKEAWGLAIEGLSKALVEGLQTLADFELPVLTDYTQDPIAAFAILEAQRHRSRGVSLDMFLGLMKYFREAYFELIRARKCNRLKKDQWIAVIQRLFDRIEIAFCMEWSQSGVDELIKDLQRRNRAMADEKGRYVSIFESHPMPVFILDKERKVIAYNLTAKQFLESAGYMDCFSLYDINRTAQDEKRSLEHGNSILFEREKPDIGRVIPWLVDDLETFIINSDSSISIDRETLIKKVRKHFHIIFSRIIDVSEKFSGVIITLEDITEQIQIAEELHQARKLESIGQLAAGIAHEINTPTQFVSDNNKFLKDGFNVFLEILEKHDELKRAAEKGAVTEALIKSINKAVKTADLEYYKEELPLAIEQSREGVSRVAEIVQAMKEFSHPGSKDKSLFDINKAIKSTIIVCRNEWRYTSNMETDLDKNLPPVPCLPGDFNQALLNIIVNAAHAIGEMYVQNGSTEKGTITVSTQQVNSFAEIRIKDTGPGIPKEIQKKIFDPFFTTKEVGRGTGQGLAIAHSTIVNKLGGKLEVLSEKGNGATFIIQLPLEEMSIPELG